MANDEGPGGESEVLVERREDGVALVTLNRPKANALSIGLLGLLAESIADAGERPSGRARALGRGADLRRRRRRHRASATGSAASRVADAFKAVTDALGELGCPIDRRDLRLRARRRARARARAATSGSRRRLPGSASPRYSSASFPGAAAPSASPGSWARRVPRIS